MHQNSISSDNDISQTLGLALKMTHVNYFDCTFYHTFSQITKLASLENRLNNISEKK